MVAGDIDFRRFALELYRVPGVSDSCLLLQDELDVDVNVVLFAAYVGAVRRCELRASDVEHVYSEVSGWHRAVTVPLRAVRRHLKALLADDSDGAVGPLREQVKAIELKSELIEIDRLGRLGTSMSLQPSSAEIGHRVLVSIQSVTGPDLSDAALGAAHAITAAAASMTAD